MEDELNRISDSIVSDSSIAGCSYKNCNCNCCARNGFNKNKKVSVLFDHIYEGNLDYVKRYLSHFQRLKPRDDINQSLRGSFDYTPLHYAVLWNRLEIVKEIIKIGGNPRIRILKDTHPAYRLSPDSCWVKAGIQPIYLAERFGKMRIAKILRPYTDDYDLLQLYFRMGSFVKCYSKGNAFFQYSVHEDTFRENVGKLLMIGNRLDIPVEIWTEILSFWQNQDIVYGLQ
tara:strand:+ start:208 stop:894 length:687 start_codon:yes stop_codon:yes gene_type:complete